MKTLDRYLVRSFFTNMVLCLGVVLALRIVMDLFINMDEFAEQKVPFGPLVAWIGKYYACHSLVYFSELGGVAIVLAAAFAVARMNASNELTAMMASGVSLRRVLLPIVICSMLMSLLVVVDREFAVPSASVRSVLVRDRDDLGGHEGIRVRLMTDGNRSVWWSWRLSPEKKEMSMPTVVLRSAHYRGLGRISGRWATPGTLDELSGWMFTRGDLVDDDNKNIRTVPAVLCTLGTRRMLWYRPPTTQEIWTSLKPEQITRTAPAAGGGVTIRDEQYGLTIQAESLAVRPAVGEMPARARLTGPRFTFRTRQGRVLGRFVADSAALKVQSVGTSWTLANGKLFYATDLTIEEIRLRESGRHVDYASSAELIELAKLERVSDRRGVIFAKHLRIAEPLNNLVMLLIGVPFILSRERNVKASVMMCLGMSILFYAFVYGSRYFDLPPVWTAWLPVLVFGPVAAYMVDAIKT